MSELDKFKRRLIRSIARRIFQQNQPEAEVWEALRKETGCDCELLWKRMRALTIKKLKRLMAGEDKLENVAAVARLSVNDWLLFDLVLVHEKIDLIDKANIARCKKESPVLEELFTLVQKHHVESMYDEQLAEAWINVTREYNSKGRQVSPMLLQRRWYQLKELTRSTFYELWFTYRGNQRLWGAATSRAQPTKLQADIARVFPNLITSNFPDWEDLIQRRKVIISFEEYMMRKREQTTESDDDKGDIEMIEPEIPTIDLDAQSDDETGNAAPPKNRQEITSFGHQSQGHLTSGSQSLSPKGNSDFEQNDSIDFDLASIKQEKLDIEEHELNTSAMTQPAEDVSSTSDAKTRRNDQLNLELQEMKQHIDSLTDGNENETRILDGQNVTEENNINHIRSESEGITAEEDIPPDDLIKLKAEEFIKSKKRKSDTAPTLEIQEGGDDDTVDDIIRKKADDFARKVDMKKHIDGEKKLAVDEIIIDKVESKADYQSKKPVDMNVVDDGIEFVDDGIDDEDDIINFDIQDASVSVPVFPTPKITSIKSDSTSDEDEKVETKTRKGSLEQKFDLKLLMNPVVCTVKLDEMKIFKERPFHCVEEPEVLTKAAEESLPVKKTVQLELELEKTEDDEETEHNKQIDVDEKIEHEKSDTEFDIRDNLTTETQGPIEDTTKIPKADVINVKIEYENDGENDDSSASDETEIDESLKVTRTSQLLQKPKYRTYTPIQVCKNPDFNTRLKRLTAGFFCSNRNRQLLNACKPLTIDVNKVFESKLVNGTLYLKSSEETPTMKDKVPRPEKIAVKTPAVVPSAMSIQSLLNQAESKADITDLVATPGSSQSGLIDDNYRSNEFGSTSLTPEDIAARNKVINLRDLSEIRRINQKLLTAEVTPMRVQRSEDSAASLQQLQAALLQDIQANSPAQTQEAVQPRRNPSADEPTRTLHLPSNPEPVAKKNPWQSKALHKLNYNYHQLPYRKISVPWRPKATPAFSDDTCITIDTLNRMINKLDGYDEKRGKDPGKLINTPKTIPADKKPDPPAEPEKKSAEVGKKPAAEVVKKPAAAGETSQKSEPASAKPTICCWARVKVDKLRLKQKTTRRHLCHGICRCCCRELLLQELARHPVSLSRMMRTEDPITRTLIPAALEPLPTAPPPPPAAEAPPPANLVSIELSDDEPEPEPPQPKVRVYSGDNFLKKPKGSKRVMVDVPHSVLPDNVRPMFKVNINFTPAPAPVEEPAAPVLSISPLTVGAVQSPTPQLVTPLLTPAPTILNSSLPPALTVPHEADSSLDDPPVTIPYIQRVSPNKPVINTEKHNIIIDASKTRLKPKSKCVPTLVNYQKFKDTPKECPIFLGQNKVLLTTVKFPPDIALSKIKKNEEVLQPKVMPTSSLPNGVQLVLLPNGEVGCDIQPDAQLTQQEADSLPAILAAVQKQISERAEIVQALSNLQHTNDSNEVIQALNSIASVENKKAADLGNSIVSDIIPVEDGDGVSSVPNVVEAQNADPQNVDTRQNADATQNVAGAAGESTEEAGGSRNLLSDLMEMSGISSEDVTPGQNVATQTAGATTDGNSSLDPTMLPTVETTELTPITTLSQLKYACQENGKFFKLDLVTGLIVPINVCIRKHVKNTVALPKSVIDLTDDGDKDSEIEPEKAAVKPVKLFKVNTLAHNRPSLLRRIKSKFTASSVEKQSGSSEPLPKKARKQNLNNVDTRIDLVDSDTPMEEEYLVDNFDSDDEGPQKIATVQDAKQKSESGDSSDDEPLAKKSVRIKNIDKKKLAINESFENNATSLEENETAAAEDLTEPVEIEADKPDDTIDRNNSDIELEESAMLPFLTQENEANDDDCILGV